MEDKKKSILTEALTDYNDIMEAADKNAKNKLAKELPEKFNELVKEELKSKNKKAKESVKDDAKKNKESVETDETKLNDESDMKNQVKETTKVEKNAKTTLKEEFEVNQSTETQDEFGLNELLTLDEIEAELAKFEPEETAEPEEITTDLQTEPESIETSEEPETSDEELYEKLLQLRSDLDSAIEALNVEKNDEMPDDIEIPDDEEIEDLLKDDGDEMENNDEIEEAHGVSYSARRNATGRHLPDAAHLSQGELDQAPMQMQESNKKIKALINENKELTKKVNVYKTKQAEINETVNKFKVVIGKYRQQLTEMAVFNTNIAHVNNILVNESLALTQEDKFRVINEFKTVTSITESQSKYENILNEMKEGKKSITESVEEKITTVIDQSSKHKLDEVVEKTAYKNNEHVNRIKSIINKIEKKKNF